MILSVLPKGVSIASKAMVPTTIKDISVIFRWVNQKNGAKIDSNRDILTSVIRNGQFFNQPHPILHYSLFIIFEHGSTTASQIIKERSYPDQGSYHVQG